MRVGGLSDFVGIASERSGEGIPTKSARFAYPLES